MSDYTAIFILGSSFICGVYVVNSLVKFVNYLDHPCRIADSRSIVVRSHRHYEEEDEAEEDSESDAFNDGYDCALEEFEDQCMTSFMTTLNYVKKNLKLLDDKDKLDPQYVKSSLLLLVLPKWTLTVNDKEYVVRATQKMSWTNAWVIPKEASDILDEKLREVVLKSLPDMNDTRIEHLQRCVRKNMYEAIDDLVSVYAH
jgi:hypothetical protein